MAIGDWRLSWFKRAQVTAIAGVGYPLVNALGQTLRWRVEGLPHLDAIHASGRQPVMAFWHGRILPATFYFRRRGIVVITSENFDGEWIARIIERFGYGTARGSTSRGGAQGDPAARARHGAREAGGFHAGWTSRTGTCRATWRALARADDREPGAAVSSRSITSLDAAELGSDADSAAVQHGRAGGRCTDGRCCGRDRH